MPRRPITSQTSYIVALVTGNRMVRISGEPSGLRRGVPSASTTRTWAPSQLCLPRAAGKIPARAGLVAAWNRLHFMVDRAPGQNAGRDVEDLVGRVGIEIGRGHGADAALAEAPRGRGVGLGDFLLHLHERFRAAPRCRQSSSAAARGKARSRSAPVSPPASAAASARSRRRRARSRAPALSHAPPGRGRDACSCASSHSLVFCASGMVAYPRPSIKAAGAPCCFTPSPAPDRATVATAAWPTGSSAPRRRRQCRWRRSRHRASYRRGRCRTPIRRRSGPSAMPRLAKAETAPNMRAHDAHAEIFAHQHGVERHHAAIGEAEDHRQRIELAELADREIGARPTCACTNRPPTRTVLGAEAIGQHAEQQAAAEAGEAGEAVDGDRGQRRDAADRWRSSPCGRSARNAPRSRRNAPAPA